MLGDYHLLLSSLGSLFLVLRKSFSVHAHSPYSALIHKLSPLSGTYILGTNVWKVWKKKGCCTLFLFPVLPYNSPEMEQGNP